MSLESSTARNQAAIGNDLEPARAPEVLLAGRFRLYETPNGGYKLVYRVDGEDDDRPHIDVPAAMVKAAKIMGSNGPGAMGKIFGTRG